MRAALSVDGFRRSAQARAVPTDVRRAAAGRWEGEAALTKRAAAAQLPPLVVANQHILHIPQWDGRSNRAPPPLGSANRGLRRTTRACLGRRASRAQVGRVRCLRSRRPPRQPARPLCNMIHCWEIRKLSRAPRVRAARRASAKSAHSLRENQSPELQAMNGIELSILPAPY